MADELGKVLIKELDDAHANITDENITNISQQDVLPFYHVEQTTLAQGTYKTTFKKLQKHLEGKISLSSLQGKVKGNQIETEELTPLLNIGTDNLTDDFVLDITKGGTGATSAQDAITNLNITPASIGAASTADIINIAHGGTGASTASEARTNLGITPANIGAVSTATIISIANGGTGASTASAALSNLGGLPLTGGTITGELRSQITDATRGSNPSTSLYRAYAVTDKNNKRLGIFEIGVLNNKTMVLNSWLLGHHTGSDQYGGLQITKSLDNTNNAVLSFNANTGLLSAGSFSGNGASLTSLNANNISSGTLPMARGGTGATTRIQACKNLLSDHVTAPNSVFALTNNHATCGWTTINELRTSLGLKNLLTVVPATTGYAYYSAGAGITVSANFTVPSGYSVLGIMNIVCQGSDGNNLWGVITNSWTSGNTAWGQGRNTASGTAYFRFAFNILCIRNT